MKDRTMFKETEKLKEVDIYVRGGQPLHKPPYFEGFIRFRSFRKLISGGVDGTAQCNIIAGAIYALEQLTSSCNVTIHTAEKINSVNKSGALRGRNKGMKQRLLEVAREKGHSLQFKSSIESDDMKNAIYAVRSEAKRKLKTSKNGSLAGRATT